MNRERARVSIDRAPGLLAPGCPVEARGRLWILASNERIWRRFFCCGRWRRSCAAYIRSIRARRAATAPPRLARSFLVVVSDRDNRLRSGVQKVPDVPASGRIRMP